MAMTMQEGDPMCRYRVQGRILAPDWSYPFDYRGELTASQAR